MKKSRASLPFKFISKDFPTRVVSWFEKNARDLPWRQTSDPYAIWVSEIMCQQTTVGTASSYFERFIKKFPKVEDLARAKEEQVLKLWEGLGYYSRARNLHRAAQIVVHKFGGELPRTKDEILELPGIGQYSAGAILSISRGLLVPALDGNLIRVYSRLYAFSESVDQPTALKKLWQIAEINLPKDGKYSRSFTEGMMELGATICTPKNPKCVICPVQNLCKGRQQGEPEKFPIKLKKILRTQQGESIYIVEKNKRIGFLPKGGDPKFPHFQRLPFKDSVEKRAKPLFSTKYAITTRDYKVNVYREKPQQFPRLQYLTACEAEKILLPAIDRKILAELNLPKS